ncbi:MAG: CRTAC1 family protein [Gammaproteobacteria bacterium]|nr:CRTAC1 family protein [Gammaproteobacteria bacterium]
MNLRDCLRSATRTALCSGVFVLAALFSACGGSGSDEPPPSPQNSAPTITANARPSVDEGVAGAIVTSVSTSDADGDSVEVSVDDERFEVSGGNLKLKEGESLDFEEQSSIEVTLTASDGEDSVTQLVRITVNRYEPGVQFTDATDASGIRFDRGYLEASDFSLYGRDADVQEFGGGVAAGDYDNDGLVDLFVVRGDIGPNLLYRNVGDNTFEDVAHQAGVANTKSATENHPHSGPGFADMDGDGYLDLFIGGIEDSPSRVFRNNGDGTFSDVTTDSGLETMTARYTISSAFGDYDLDGDLDLFLAHWGTLRVPETESTESLWRNDTADGVIRFTDVSRETGVASGVLEGNPVELGTNKAFDYTFSPSLARINGDRYPDIVVAADFDTSKYLVNNGDGTFSNRTDPDVIVDRNGMGSALGDYDGDGDLDWFVSSIWTDPAGDGNQTFRFGNRLYRNDEGVFADVTDEVGVHDGGWGWGSCFADFDNDGHLDIYHTNGWPPTEQYEEYEFEIDQSRLFMSNGEGLFFERAAEAGVADQERGHGVVCGDFDNDGDVDIFLMHRDDNNAGTFWRNDTATNNYLRVKLNGLASNTAAAGARITLTVDDASQMREIVIGSNFTSQNPLVQVFGLGSSAQADIEVEWPDGEMTPIRTVSANQLITINHPDR